jgi:hypothetical protein
MYQNYSYRILKQEDQNIFDLNQIKNYIRISIDYDDNMLLSMLDGVIQIAENFIKLSLVNRVIEVIASESNGVMLPFVPMIRILDVKRDDNPIQLDDLDIKNHEIKIRNKTKYKSLKVSYLAGYEDPSLIPSPIKQGILLHLASMYDSRGTTYVCPESVLSIYKSYRKMVI